ncbi:MAG: hypothetical protein EXR72_22240 [Myxococcales bacterium]|nr:hypothetical protein [Myxococcales bacterium]
MFGEFSTVEADVLRAVNEGRASAGEIKKPPKAARDEAITKLAARGLIVQTKEGRKVLLALTPDGSAAAASLPAKARKAAAPRRSQDAALVELCTLIEDRFARLEAKIDRLALRSDGAVAAVSPAPLSPAILAAVRDLDARHRFGGVVPIPALRTALREQGLSATDAEVSDALVALERDFVIDLLIAQSPATLPDRAAGIERPGRGLAYYVAPRSP